jgi:hypothetical protein
MDCALVFELLLPLLLRASSHPRGDSVIAMFGF